MLHKYLLYTGKYIKRKTSFSSKIVYFHPQKLMFSTQKTGVLAPNYRFVHLSKNLNQISNHVSLFDRFPSERWIPGGKILF